MVTDRPRPLHAVPATTAPAVPAESAGVPETAPDLLAALDAGDEEAVYAWFRAHTPDTGSLLVYAALASAGAIGLMEWPAVALAALGQLVIDRRLGGVENLAAQLRARVDAITT